MDSRDTSIDDLMYEEDGEEKITLLADITSSDLERNASLADLASHWRRISTGQWITTRTHRALTNLLPPLRQTAIFLLPSFIHPLLSKTPRHPTTAALPPPRPRPRPQPSPLPPPHPTPPNPKRPTAHLDGLRGLAALTVFACHFLYTSFAIAPGYGAFNAHHHLALLPFLRLLFSGPPAVCVFFVVSGYALSLRPAQAARARDWAGRANALASFVLRRGVRLFLPVVASTGAVVGLVWVGGYEWTREFAGDGRFLRNVREPHYGPRLGSVGEQVADWVVGLGKFVHVWDWELFGGSTAMDVHLWSVPVEFRCSMVLFLTLLAVGRLRRGWWWVVVGGLVMFVYFSKRWEMVLFYAGMVLAEVDVARGLHGGCSGADAVLPGPGLMMSESRSRPRSPSPSPPRTERRPLRRAMWTTISIVGLYLMSQPDVGGAETPGWVFLTSLIPSWWDDEHRYWQSAGAILFVLTVGRSRGWQRFFNLDVVQYFGKISYALYLMHGPVLHTLGYAIQRWAWGLTGIEGSAYAWGFALAAVFIIPVVIWVSDVFWRAVDAPVVRFAKWLEAKCSISE
jgi:peptidoglycan/LPS O-acetylase OafA/YrhL